MGVFLFFGIIKILLEIVIEVIRFLRDVFSSIVWIKEKNNLNKELEVRKRK
ncbi:hypothetical protein BJV85_002828 [Clostridium acetobutylicum]|uniref:hypothetical protein n=1 Tax=Clostridium TaxID=1485 RepID=UPI00031E5FD0|nr:MULTISPECIES: hypothetical protein [Clostridium]MBC2393248.1 hypothetical protein [Clostridium acetobutylicum]MBC2585794.1 hypothetical protein [Clostridium acetobutylicum]NOV89991.1 hypothetical protein [Clostridium acetobutylicum]NOW15481.1 hypothetical protein [Clostridium acetobutylicum]NRY57161.1 hypothetical protein [Clostridium acetobutylicum]